MAENKRDYYEVLGLQKGASDDDIKKAFRQMAKSTIPISTPATRKRRPASRRSNEACTRCCRCAEKSTV